jgi:hypothetical protein
LRRTSSSTRAFEPRRAAVRAPEADVRGQHDLRRRDLLRRGERLPRQLDRLRGIVRQIGDHSEREHDRLRVLELPGQGEALLEKRPCGIAIAGGVVRAAEVVQRAGDGAVIAGLLVDGHRFPVQLDGAARIVFIEADLREIVQRDADAGFRARLLGHCQ